MKKIISLLLIISLGIANANAQTPEVQDLVAKGVKLHDSGDFNGAIELYKQALAIDEKSPLVNYELSSSYFSLKNYEKAIEYADHVIDYGKDYVKDAYILKGSAEDLAGRSEDAVQTYKKAIKKFPDSYLLHYNLALTSYNNRDNKTAEESLQKALLIRPTHGSSHLLLGYVMQAQGSRVKSLLALYNFLLLEPNGPRTESAYKFLLEQLKQGVSKGKDKKTPSILPSIPGKTRMNSVQRN
ncbi:tetratricopeptide repeat protein [Ferruginibacter sp.]